MSSTLRVDVQSRLTQSLPTWYPELSRNSVPIVFILEKKFRWSRHYIFQVIDRANGNVSGILTKSSLQRHDDGRRQVEVRPSSDALLMEFRALSLLYEHLNTREIDGITAVRPLQYFADIRTLAIEYMPGQNMLSLTLDAAKPWAKKSDVTGAVSAAYDCGRLLYSLHQIKQSSSYPKKIAFEAPTFSHKLQEKISTLLNLVSQDDVRQRLLSVQQFADKRALSLHDQVTVSYLHGDLYPENLVRLSDGRVYTIDTTLHQVGPVEFDIAKFLVGIHTMKRRILLGPIVVRYGITEAIGESFLAGYCARARLSLPILLLAESLALVQRWIEVLEVLACRSSTRVISSFIQGTRINPFMLTYLESIQTRFQRV